MQLQNIQDNNKVSMLRAIGRGLMGRCPRCGKGRLLASFLKPVINCAVCQETLGDIRADDGPPWLTVLIVGHILLPLIFMWGPQSDWPQGMLAAISISVAVILMALILPRAKGLFIGIIWKNRQMTGRY